MAIKSVIDVDIDRNGEFSRFKKLYDEWDKKVNQAPKSWQKVRQGIKGAALEFGDLVEAEMKSINERRKMIEVERVAQRAMRTSADTWRDMARSTKTVMGNVRDITGSLLKWSTLTSVFSGIVGAGGLFGITRLGESAALGRQQAMGIGTTFGGARAFATNYGRITDPDSLLSGVNQALTNPANRAALYNAGLRENELGGGTAAVAARLIDKLKDIADQTPDSLLGAVHGARSIGQFMSPEAFQRLKATSRGELEGLRRGFGRDVGALGVDDSDLRKWQDFTTQMQRAGNEIQKVFINGLSPLAPAFEELSKSVTQTLRNFLGSDGLKDTIEKIGKGIEKFGKYIGTDEFQTDVEKFARGFSRLASVVGWFGGGGPTVRGETEGHDTYNSMWRNSRANRRAVTEAVTGLATGGASIKPGAGEVSPGLGKLYDYLSGRVPGIKQLTSANDEFHKGRPGSAHNDGRAFDLSLKDPSRSAIVAQQIREELDRLGIKGKVIDEYKNPSAGATGGHIHVQADKHVDIRIFNQAGSDTVVSAQQVAQ